MFKQFLGIFLSKLPDRFALLVIVIGIVCMSSFAYDTVGLPIQTASAESLHGADGAAASAINWTNTQMCLGDHIRPETVATDVSSVGNDTYSVKLTFTSLEYSVDQGTGGLHHIPVDHSVDMVVSQGRVISAYENYRDLVDDQAFGPVMGVSADYL